MLDLTVTAPTTASPGSTVVVRVSAETLRAAYVTVSGESGDLPITVVPEYSWLEPDYVVYFDLSFTMPDHAVVLNVFGWYFETPDWVWDVSRTVTIAVGAPPAAPKARSLEVAYARG